MCVFPAPNSARFARNFPLFRLIRPVPTTFGSLAGRIPLQREKTDPPMRLSWRAKLLRRLLCSFAANHPALRYSVTSLFNPPPTAKNPHEVVNPCNCNTCETCKTCDHILSQKLATLDFPRCPRPSPCSKPSQNHPPSTPGRPALRPPSRFTIHDSRLTFPNPCPPVPQGGIRGKKSAFPPSNPGKNVNFY
jgi:hypothetical protein